MKQLPQEISEEIHKGNFVVKCSQGNFNQVDPDQAQEWLNAVGKSNGGIVGITKTTSAMNRWALSFNLRSQIAEDTKKMFNIKSDCLLEHDEAKPGRKKIDNAKEKEMYDALVRYKVLQVPAQSEHQFVLQNVVTKNLTTESIQDSLLHATGSQEQLSAFITERLVSEVDGHPQKKFHGTLHLNKAPTFESLYEIKTKSSKTDKEIVLQADRSILQ